MKLGDTVIIEGIDKSRYGCSKKCNRKLGKIIRFSKKRFRIHVKFFNGICCFSSRLYGEREIIRKDCEFGKKYIKEIKIPKYFKD